MLVEVFRGRERELLKALGMEFVGIRVPTWCHVHIPIIFVYFGDHSQRRCQRSVDE